MDAGCSPMPPPTPTHRSGLLNPFVAKALLEIWFGFQGMVSVTSGAGLGDFAV